MHGQTTTAIVHILQRAILQTSVIEFGIHDRLWNGVLLLLVSSVATVLKSEHIAVLTSKATCIRYAHTVGLKKPGR